MPVSVGVLDRGVPDVVDTRSLPDRLAAEVDHLAGRTDRWATGTAIGPGIRARALVVEGRADDARAVLATLRPAGAGTGMDVQDLAAGAWAASRVGEPRVADALGADVPDGGDDGFLVVDDVPLGHRSYVRGLLAVTRGDLDAAEALLRDAVEQGDRRAPLWGALARVELARVRWTVTDLLGADDDRRSGVDEARRIALAARTFFVAGGYRHLVSTTAGLFGAPQAGDGAEPRLGHLVEQPTTWTVGFGSQPPVRVRPTKGLLAVRHLVEHRDRPVAAVELDRVIDGEDPGELAPDALLAAVAAGELAEEDLRPALLDPRARSRVTKLLRRTIDRLGDEHETLRRHLAGSVRTGYVCRYEADPAITWRT